MNQPGLYLTKDQLDFIRYVASKVEASSELFQRMDKCINTIRADKSHSIPFDESLDDIRKNHTPGLTAEFLSLFGSSSGLKFLTHDFDPDSDMTISNLITQTRSILSLPKYYNKLPKSLFALISSFIGGNRAWRDYSGKIHNNSLSTGGLNDWIVSNPTLHPITSPQFGDEIQDFRNTVRISKPILAKLIASYISNNQSAQNLRIKFDKLDKADFYTNVDRLINFIIGKVLLDIAQRESTAEVCISYERSNWNEYRLCKIIITHVGSEANPFDDVRKKCISGGGSLFELAKNCKSYCDWTVEANFEGEYKRWRILSAQNLPEVELLDKSDTLGFSHIFTFYKY